MKLLLISLFALLQPNADDFKLQNGDLIFQEACSGDVATAIKDVTKSSDGNQFTHVGIVYIDENENVFVLEATHPKVILTPLNEYLYPQEHKDSYPKSVVGRLKNEYQHCIPKALKEGMNLIGKDYDYGYILNNDQYYCSELVYDILLKANNGLPVFPLNVMTFKSSETGEFTKEWIDYFDRLDVPVPEGEMGINPGAMSRSDVLSIIHYY
ncbi:YiiX/YebB-like N1pC/P60 family cysteine hydrolase [Dysgonomonas sp. ZJ279]|uniref:YiiX/YebB-like N1pC/P60 family cysteine hydrolase n=1 Tax=Dysgonomonas sp. ZJ279 TaxID=2709796 RepID=UPI0013EB4147|nr:YiiX/YebB-like N1pC/P60 family cysteine hydrolase [Dysgonomonas sp. ZJ279]